MGDKYRAETWKDYIGQRKLKDRLSIEIEAAKSHDEKLPHIFLHGPPGCGKTTIANIISDEIELPLLSYVMPIKPIVLRQILFQEHCLVFLDEIHRLSNKQQEEFLTILEDGYYQADNGLRIENDTLTFIGATTEQDKVIKPLIDRFEVRPKFEEYSDRQMARILMAMAKRVGYPIEPDVAEALGRATGGTPRNAKAIVNMARNLDTDDVGLILQKCALTPDGFDEYHIEYLEVLQKSGTLAGLELLASHLQLSKSSILDLERLLVKRGAIQHTKAGRQMTSEGYKILKEHGK